MMAIHAAQSRAAEITDRLVNDPNDYHFFGVDPETAKAMVSLLLTVADTPKVRGDLSPDEAFNATLELWRGGFLVFWVEGEKVCWRPADGSNPPKPFSPRATN